MDLIDKKSVNNGGGTIYTFVDDLGGDCKLVVGSDGAVLFTDQNATNFDTAWTIREDEHGLYFAQVVNLMANKNPELKGADVTDRDLTPNEFIQGLIYDARESALA